MIRKLFKSFGIPLIIFIVGGLMSGPVSGKYIPPAIVFQIVWPILYLMMGVSAFLVIRKKDKNAENKVLLIYYIQLLLNFSWIVLFFQFDLKVFALIDLIVLYIFVSINTIMFYKEDKISGILLIPYFLWLTAAIFFNATLV